MEIQGIFTTITKELIAQNSGGAERTLLACW